MSRDLRRPRNASYIGSGWAVHRNETCDRQPHKHDALQLVLAPQGEALVQLRGATLRGSGLLIGSGVIHSVCGEPASPWMVYVDRDCECAEALGKLLGPDGAIRIASALERGARCLIRDVLDRRGDAEHAFDRFSAGLGGPKTGRPSDARVEKALTILAHKYRSQWPLAGLLRASGLSESHFGVLFKACTGLPLRTHVRWLRISAAVDALAEGIEDETAASAAGYSSALQFVNSFRHIFGVRPHAFATSLARDLGRAVLDNRSQP